MKGTSAGLMFIAGFLVAPFLTTFVSEFFSGGYGWLPYVIVLLLGGVLYAVGVLRWTAIGLLAGLIVFAACLMWFPRAIAWLPVNVRTLQPPF